jgi:hypothetical protein
VLRNFHVREHERRGHVLVYVRLSQLLNEKRLQQLSSVSLCPECVSQELLELVEADEELYNV